MSRIRNFEIHRDLIVDSLLVTSPKPPVGYTLAEDSGSQAFVANTEAQLLIDAAGSETINGDFLWNSTTNRIDLTTVRVNDIIEVDVLLPSMVAGVVYPQVTLDYSVPLDNSLVIPPFRNGILTIGSAVTENSAVLHFSFPVNQMMKDNGIGINVVYSTNVTTLGPAVVIKHFKAVR
jgi:hypothetical protein